MSTNVLFEYRARDKSGRVHAGEIEGSSGASVARALREKGYVPLKIEEQQVSALDREISIPGFSKRVKLKEVAVFSRQLATMVNSGLTLVRALTVLEAQTESAALGEIVGQVRREVEQGTTLSEAMSRHPKAFNRLYVAMVRAGEAGGALDETLIRLAETLESAVRLRSKVRSAMAYPVVVLALVILIVAAMLLFIVPIFQRLYEDLGGSLPLPTQLLINISSVLTSLWWLILLAVVGGVIGFRRWIATDAGRHSWDAFKLRVPIMGGLVRKVAISRFSRTFSVLSRTGVPVLQALDIVATTTGNSLVADAITDAQRSVKRGESLSTPLAKHEVFPPMVTHMMSVGEETGAMDAMLEKVADFYDSEVDATVNALASLIEPILIIVMGVAVGGILISLYLPMFNIANLIQ
jgi:type IV pilus assembly protein PilC